MIIIIIMIASSSAVGTFFCTPTPFSFHHEHAGRKKPTMHFLRRLAAAAVHLLLLGPLGERASWKAGEWFPFFHIDVFVPLDKLATLALQVDVRGAAPIIIGGATGDDVVFCAENSFTAAESRGENDSTAAESQVPRHWAYGQGRFILRRSMYADLNFGQSGVHSALWLYMAWLVVCRWASGRWAYSCLFVVEQRAGTGFSFAMELVAYASLVQLLGWLSWRIESALCQKPRL